MHPSEEPVRVPGVMEHRWGRRISLEVPVRLDLAGRSMGRGLLRNASISGALIETPLELPVYTNLVVALPATCGAASGPVELAACVVRHEVATLAVEWRDMACDPIVKMLERYSGRRAAILRDDHAYIKEKKSCAFASL